LSNHLNPNNKDHVHFYKLTKEFLNELNMHYKENIFSDEQLKLIIRRYATIAYVFFKRYNYKDYINFFDAVLKYMNENN